MANRGVSVGVKINGDAKGFKSAAEEARQATQKLKKEIEFKSQQRKLNDLTATLGKLGLAFSALAVVNKMAQLTKESFQLAVAAEGIEIAFKRLNDPALLDDLRKATKGTVDDVTLMKKAVQANNLNVPVQQLATYFEFAHRRARDTGESVDYLVDSIVTGIGRKSVMILDNLGISSVELNEQLKLTPNYAEAVSIIIEKSMKNSGDYISTTADSVDQLKTAMTNLKVEVGDMFNDVLAKPLAESAKSLSDVISGISDLRKELDLGGVNKDVANQIRGNIAMASGTPAGQLMAMLFGGRGAGKNEILIPAATPIIKKTTPTTTLNEPTSGVDNVFGDGYLQAQVQAAIEWNEYAEQIQRKYDLIDTTGKSIAGTSLNQIPTLNSLVEATEEWNYNFEEISSRLEGIFNNLFRAGIEGWDEFGEAAISTIKNIAAEIATKAAIWMLLNIINPASGGMKLGEYLLGGFGVTKAVGSVPIASGSTVLKGRDIFISGNRYGNTLIKNT